MKRKIVWLVVSFLAALSFLLASCAPTPTATPTTTAPTTTAPTAPATTAPTTAAPAAGKPTYGGRLTYAMLNDTRGFDQFYQTTSWAQNAGQDLVNDRLLVGDWANGPAGTGKFDLSISGWAPEGLFREVGMLAESWSVPDDQTVIFKIRQGVRFHNKPPVNGREMDANDVAYSINYMYSTPNAYLVVSAPGGKKMLGAKALDKWTVEVKVEDLAWGFFEDIGVKGVHIIAPEVVKQYGDLKDWRNANGTGGYFITDYVPDSSMTFVKNPNYWMKNPVGPGQGDQLPYVDGLSILIIKDRSTAQAAFRTGKIDMLGPYTLEQTYDDFQAILKTNPDTKWARIEGPRMKGLGIRLSSTDPLAKPLLNQRVRWALSMAINREEMVKNLYAGEAPSYVHFFPTTSPYYIAPKDFPEVLEKVHGVKAEDAALVAKSFEYDPATAKKILAEEGYPNGFKTVVITSPDQVDFLSIIKAYWEKNLNVELAIDSRADAVYSNVIDKHETQALFYYAPSAIGTNPAKWIYYGPGDPALPLTVSNRWELRSPVLDSYMQKTNAVYGKDLDQQNKLLREFEPYLWYLAPHILTPWPNTFVVWQPWLQNFYGFEDIGFRGHHNWTYFAWVDQDVKKAKGQ